MKQKSLVNLLILIGGIAALIYGIYVSLDWLIVIAVICFVVYLVSSKRTNSVKYNKNSRPSAEKEAHYREQGMTDKEITFFRDTMKTAKQQIIDIEKTTNQSAKLKAINLRNNTLRAAKGVFKELVKDPRKLHQANDFLYTHLPNLKNLSERYLEIDSHDIKNKQTYETLDKSAHAIDDLSKLIVSDYTDLTADDLEDMEVEISIAQQSVDRTKTQLDDMDDDF